MLGQVLKDWPTDCSRFKTHPSGMSATQQIQHLTECYMAFEAHCDGAPFSWGAYAPPSDDWAVVVAAFENARHSGLSRLAAPTEEMLEHLNAYVIAHDHYHIGQLCALRIACDQTWDPYCIYQT